MAVDIKQLRVGSHVEVNGVRARVIDIHRNVLNSTDSSYRVFCEVVRPTDGKLIQVGGSPANDVVKPIKITPELLAELGFKKREGGLIWSKIFDRNCYVSFSPFEDNCWSLSITPKDYRKRITVFINNLHEAENIIWLTLHKELFEE